MNFADLTLEQWIDIGLALVVLLGTAILGRWIIKLLFSRVIRRLTGFTKNTLDDAVLDAIAPPLYWLALIYAFQFALDRIDFLFGQLRFDLDQVYFVLYLLIGFVVVWRLVGNIADWYGEQLAKTGEVELGEQLLPFFRRIILIILAIIGALALASIPLALGWRRTADEASMARAMGLNPPKRVFDPEKFARQTGSPR